MKRTLGIAMVLFAATAVMGCTAPEEDSCNIKTAGIYVQYEVFEEGNSARAEATFWVGDKPGGTYLTLGDCGDAITVNGQGLRKNTSNINHDFYEVSLAAADSYEFIFSRQDEDPYTSSVSTRAPVVVTSPTASTSISRADAFDVTWDANDSGMVTLLIDGECIDEYPNMDGDDVADNGTYAVRAGDIEPHMSSDADKSCTADVILTRESGGTLDGSLKGEIKGNSIGRTSFTSTP